ncbi:hypothetical protein BCR35DRAFT_355162 [Leucosporidium creatinivorum]|uniref:Uncharacterized protein n=1 Tax=Leucosporidium creatinivorum TaxID=106004 RepID=A0A1Y2DTF3_9BASI|nr:hypothetical protein BCR35DRAFT_355162 [Leucosporidium creatinivorum]
MSSSSPDTDRLDQLFTQVESTISSTWQLISCHSPNLHHLPQQLHQHFLELIDRVSNQGTLPLPSFNTITQTPAPPPPPPPPPPPANAFNTLLHNHPYLATAILTSAVGGTAYYCAPHQTIQIITPLVSPLRPYTPLCLLPTSSRPLRITTDGGQVRKEAVLVLGAEGLLAELALDLENRGFVVIATVSDPTLVDHLEKRSRGWIKVLVLDPTESSSVPPFLRSLSTSLSLRFPLHTSGDPFSRPSHTLALTSVINGLSLSPSPSPSTELYPIEGLDVEHVRKEVGERVQSWVKVVQGLLPVLRGAAARPGAPEGVLLSLFPSSHHLSTPFLSLPSTTHAALHSLLHSLRRELNATEGNRIRVKSLEVGVFDSPASEAREKERKELPLRLSSLYAPALARRSVIISSSSSSSSATSNAGGRTGTTRRKGRKPTHPNKLHQKVFDILIYSRGGVSSSVGAGALSNRLLPSYLPTTLLDFFYTLQDRLASFYLSHLQRRRQSITTSSPPSSTGSGSGSGRRPLPTPPPSAPQGPGQGHPESLRPATSPTTATSQIPVDHFSAGGGSGYASSEESSIEEFGSLSGSYKFQWSIESA